MREPMLSNASCKTKMGVIGRKAREILLIPKGENEMSRISLSLINYNLQHFRLFLFFHSLLGVKPIANILINNGIFRRNLDKLFCLFLYPALWADKFHK